MTGDYSSIGKIDPNGSILLLGSGFSLEAKNLKDEAPPNGAQLRQHFINALELPPNTTYDLQILTDEFSRNDPERLYRELTTIFRVATLGTNQSDILSENWFRIYTTNFDDVVELAHQNRGLKPQTFDVSNPVPNRLPTNSVIHLHGSIRSTNLDKPLLNLVLGENSYVRQYLTKSPWFNQFQADLAFASNVFIIGYSMSDYHISALLLENPTVASKTFFIQGACPDEMFSRRTASYGRSLFVGLDGFAHAVKVLPRPEPISDLNLLKCFRLLDPQKDKKGLKPPTASEIYDMLAFGFFNYSRCVSTLPKQTYVISRSAEVDSLISEISKNRTVIVDGRLGNGKTIFLYLSFIALAARGYTCFLFKEASASINEEIKLLSKVQKLVVIFDEYTRSQDILKKLSAELPEARFILEIRSSIFEVRYHEIARDVPKPFSRIGVNRLSRDDVAAFRELCDKSGLGTSNLPQDTTSREMRDILLELFESENIKTKLRNTLAPIFETTGRRKILLLCSLLAEYHASSDASFIKTVTDIDPYREFASVQETAEEVFEMSLYDFRIRSSVFSEFVVQHFLNPAEIIECVVDTAFAAAARKSERRYRVLMSNLMQYSNLHLLLQRQSSASEKIVGVYERLRYDERINDEPLFWLQYAIAMAEDGKLQTAEEFIETAYNRARARDGFQTYQIDTQALRILLLAETKTPPGAPVVRLGKILEKLELVNSMLNEESHRWFAIKVLEGLPPFVGQRLTDLAQSQKVALTYWLSILSKTLEHLPVEYRARSGSDGMKLKIDKAKQLLLQL